MDNRSDTRKLKRQNESAVEWLCLNRLASVPCSHASAVCSRREREVSEFLTPQQTADLAGVKAEQIRVRIEMGE